MSRTVRDPTFLEDVVLGTTRGLLTLDGSGCVVFANDPIGAVLDRAPGEIVGEPVTTFLTDGEAALDRIRAADAAAGSDRVRTSLRTAAGEAVPVVLHVSGTEREDDRFRTLTIVEEPDGQDERSRKETERVVRQLFDHRPEALFVIDPVEAVIVDCNRRARELLGVGENSLPSRDVRAFAAPTEPFVSFLKDVLATDEGRRETFTWEPATGESHPVEVVASPVEFEGDLLVLATVRDVTERRRLRRQRRRLTAALEATDADVAVLDEEFEHTQVTESYAARFGHERSDLDGEPFDRVLAAGERIEERVALAVDRSDRWRGPLECITADGRTTRADCSFRRLADGAVVTVVRDSADGSVAERTDAELAGLAGTRHRLTDADSAEAVATAWVETVEEGLGFDLGCVRLRTGDAELEPAAMTSAARSLVDDTPGFELGLSDAGRAYRTGEPVVREGDGETAVGDLLGASVHYPIGEHGVLTVATTEDRSFTRGERAVLSVLAVGVAGSLDRIDAASVSGATTRGQRSPGVSTPGADVAELVRDVLGELVTAADREEFEALACSRLATAAAYDGALTAAVDSASERLQVGASAGVGETVRNAVDGRQLPAVADGAIATALETGEPVVTDTGPFVATAGSDPGPGPAASPVGIAPLTHGERVFGVLLVQGAEQGVFGADGSGLAALADTMGAGLSSLENQRLLLSDEAVQFEFQVTDPDCLAVALSEALDTGISIERTVRNARDEHVSYVHVEDATGDAALAAAESIDAVRDCRVVSEYQDDCTIEVVRPGSGAEVMMEFGATMHTAEADAGRGRLVLEAPPSVDARRVVEAYQAYNPQSELLAKRRVNRSVRTAEQLRNDIRADLTEKQLSAVAAAYSAGYYEWPRESTAEAIADSMGITASTLHQHLRRAHRKVVGDLLEAPPTGRR